MKIEVLYVPGCPNYEPTVKAVMNILKSESVPTEICVVPIHNNVEATALRFPGSPTIRVDGQDVEPASAKISGLACRLYENGMGVPSEKTIRRALAAAREVE